MISGFFKKLHDLTVTLRASILFIFISLFIITMLLIILVTTVRYTKSLMYVSKDLMEYASASVLRELTSNIKPAEFESRFSAYLIQKGVRKEEESELLPITVELNKTLPMAAGVFWGDRYGNFIYSKKEKNGTISTEIYKRQNLPATRIIISRDRTGKIIKQASSNDLSYDPRKRPWYIQVKKERKAIWTNIYLFKPSTELEKTSNPELGITSIAPVFKNGQLYGAFGVDINLNDLFQFVKNQKVTPNGYSFIITTEGKLIAYPDKKPFTEITISSEKFINVHDNSIPLISISLDKYIKSGQKKLLFSYDYEGETYIIAYQSIPALASHGWLVGVIVPKSDFTKELEQMNMITISISFIILILGIILVSHLISHIVKPIKALVAETENIKHFNLDGEIQINSKIKEVIYLRDAIRSMKIGLKLFQRYIPKILVRQLIESGENIRIGGVRKKLAIFFSDIEYFTTITEKTDPNILIIQMGEYFEELTQIIISEKGTLDKYIGDSIMAFWGAPLSDEHPCHHAANAALRCQSKLDALNVIWAKKGNSILFTRIGIHMGDAIVGNLGSSERLNYTAVGDSINIASRLEQINKNYKTKIIVSDTVYEQIKDKFILRMIDWVVVRGRSQSCFIYELLSDDILKVEFDLAAYSPFFEQGFLAYTQQRWDDAIAYFRTCLEIYPTDTIAPIFIARCQHFKSEPPEPWWNGIME